VSRKLEVVKKRINGPPRGGNQLRSSNVPHPVLLVRGIGAAFHLGVEGSSITQRNLERYALARGNFSALPSCTGLKVCRWQK
jgi:hypothetical protein